MANVLWNVSVHDDAEISHVLKDVQSGKDIDCEVVEQRIRLGMAVHDRIPVSDAVRFGIVMEHIIVVVEHAAWKESQAAQLAGGWCCGFVEGGPGAGKRKGRGNRPRKSPTDFWNGWLMLLRHVIRPLDRDSALSKNVHVLGLPDRSNVRVGDSFTKESSVPFMDGQGCSKQAFKT